MPRLYTEEQVADYLGICVRTLQKMRNNNKIGFVPVGDKLVRYTEDNIRDFIQGRMQCPHSGGKPDTKSETTGSPSIHVIATGAQPGTKVLAPLGRQEALASGS
jgi:excisionase family DNA binding protein